MNLSVQIILIVYFSNITAMKARFQILQETWKNDNFTQYSQFNSRILSETNETITAKSTSEPADKTTKIKIGLSPTLTTSGTYLPVSQKIQQQSDTPKLAENLAENLFSSKLISKIAAINSNSSKTTSQPTEIPSRETELTTKNFFTTNLAVKQLFRVKLEALKSAENVMKHSQLPTKLTSKIAAINFESPTTFPDSTEKTSRVTFTTKSSPAIDLAARSNFREQLAALKLLDKARQSEDAEDPEETDETTSDSSGSTSQAGETGQVTTGSAISTSQVWIDESYFESDAYIAAVDGVGADYNSPYIYEDTVPEYVTGNVQEEYDEKVEVSEGYTGGVADKTTSAIVSSTETGITRTTPVGGRPSSEPPSGSIQCVGEGDYAPCWPVVTEVILPDYDDDEDDIDDQYFDIENHFHEMYWNN